MAGLPAFRWDPRSEQTRGSSADDRDHHAPGAGVACDDGQGDSPAFWQQRDATGVWDGAGVSRAPRVWSLLALDSQVVRASRPLGLPARAFVQGAGTSAGATASWQPGQRAAGGPRQPMTFICLAPLSTARGAHRPPGRRCSRPARSSAVLCTILSRCNSSVCARSAGASCVEFR